MASENFIETLYGSESDNRLAYGFFGTNAYDSSSTILTTNALGNISGSIIGGRFYPGDKRVGDRSVKIRGDKGFVYKKDSNYTSVKENMMKHARNQVGSESTFYSIGMGLTKYYIENRVDKSRPVSILFMSDGNNGPTDDVTLNNMLAELENSDIAK